MEIWLLLFLAFWRLPVPSQGLYDNAQVLRSARPLWKNALSSEILRLTLHPFCDFQLDTFLGRIFEGLQRGYVQPPFPISSIRLVLSILAEHDCPCQGNFSCLIAKTVHSQKLSHASYTFVSQKHSMKRVRTGAEVYLLIFYPDSMIESVSLKSDIGTKLSFTGVWRVSCDNVALCFRLCQWGMQKPWCPTAESYMSYTGCPSGPSWWLALFCFKFSAYVLFAGNAGSPACPFCLDRSPSSSKDLDESLIVVTTFLL